MIIDEIFLEFGNIDRKNKDFRHFISEEKINIKSQKSGVFNRKICCENNDAIKLCKNLIINNNLNEKIKNQDLIIIVSENVDRKIPPPSSLIFSNIDKINCQLVDLNRGCSGFVEALNLSNSYFLSDLADKILIVCADNYSKYFTIEDTNVSTIFGDCASFTFIKNSKKNIIYSKNVSIPAGRKHISIINNKLHMNGAAVLGFVRSTVIPQISEILNFANENEIELVNAFVHQGSKFVVEEIRNFFSWSPTFCPFYIEIMVILTLQQYP